MKDITVTQTRLIDKRNLDDDGIISIISLMNWIYETAVIAAMQSCGSKVLVRNTDHHDFLCRSLSGCTFLEINAKPVHTGEFSIEIQADMFARSSDHGKFLIHRTYLTAEAVDEKLHPIHIA